MPQLKGDIPNLKAATLNIWGIRGLSKDVDLRIDSLIRELNREDCDYDLIALQEVWSKKDYLKIKQLVKDAYPYAHYFHSGIIGSGCCVLSKYYIEDTFYHKYGINGYPHMLQHGDWFAGKAVGLAIINYHGLKINAYVTHLHANYSEKYEQDEFSDVYLSHRLSQLYELMQFINHTSSGSCFTLLMGDLNTYDYEAGYKMLINHTNLKDAYLEANGQVNIEVAGATCYSKNNYYNQKPTTIKSVYPNGIRIDFVLYKLQSDSLNIRCVQSKICFEKIPGLAINFSDHEGVSAEFQIRSKNVDDINAIIKNDAFDEIEHYEKVKNILEKSEQSLNTYQMMFACLAVVCLQFIFFFHFNETYMNVLKDFVLTLMLCFSILYILVKLNEKQHLVNTLSGLDVIIKNYKLKLKN